LSNICKIYEANKKPEKKWKKKKGKEEIKIEKGLGNPSAQIRKGTHGPNRLCPESVPPPLSPPRRHVGPTRQSSSSSLDRNLQRPFPPRNSSSPIRVNARPFLPRTEPISSPHSPLPSPPFFPSCIAARLMKSLAETCGDRRHNPVDSDLTSEPRASSSPLSPPSLPSAPSDVFLLIKLAANRAPGHHPTRPRLRPHPQVDQGRR
jgi:hypothetical protein